MYTYIVLYELRDLLGVFWLLRIYQVLLSTVKYYEDKIGKVFSMGKWSVFTEKKTIQIAIFLYLKVYGCFHLHLKERKKLEQQNLSKQRSPPPPKKLP